MTEINKKDVKEKEKLLVRVHKQLFHPPSKAFKQLMQRAGDYNKEISDMIDFIEKNCEFCLRYRKTKARPVVSMPLGRSFNDVVAMDLKHFREKMYFIHFIDMFTRFCKAKVITRKLPEVVVKAFVMEWIAMGFGAPNKVLIDNGGEFNNPKYVDALEQYNVEPMATAANSPWSNGLCERNHKVVDTIVEKIVEENPGVDVDIALANAVSAKNSMMNNKGFTPIQLVTGNLPNIPSVLTNNLSAMQEPEYEDTKHHLDAMFSARRAFTEADCSERLQRALRHPVRCDDEVYEPGEKVLFKKDGEQRWRGPAKVIAQDRKVVFLHYGSRLISVSTCRICKAGTNLAGVESSVGENLVENKIEGGNENLAGKIIDDDGNDENDSDDDEFVLQENRQNKENNDQNDLSGAVVDDKPGEEASSLRRSTRTRRCPLNYNPDDGTWGENLQEEVALMAKAVNEKDPAVIEAKECEMENWQQFEVIDEVRDKGQRTISTRWVLTEKKFSDGKRGIKARLVVRGFEEENEVQVDSPTASKSTVRLSLAIAANEGWNIESIDVRSAFLQSNKIEREVYVEPPKEFKKEGLIWRLRKPAYGLNDAARAWYMALREELLNLGCKQSEIDKGAFRWMSQGVLGGFFILHVDDILTGGVEKFRQEVLDKLILKFKIGTHNILIFRYVGLEIHQDQNGIRLSQYEYVDEMNEISVKEKPKADDEKLKKLMYATTVV